jgi:hypothetical protein
MKCWAALCLGVFLALGLWAGSSEASLPAQRMSDKDVERMMTNLKNDAKRFGDAFNPAIGKSTVRKTQQEKDAKALVKTFQNQTNAMLTQFKTNKQAEPALSAARDSASRIEKILADVPLGPQVGDSWTKVRTELNMVSDAFR